MSLEGLDYIHVSLVDSDDLLSIETELETRKRDHRTILLFYREGNKGTCTLVKEEVRSDPTFVISADIEQLDDAAVGRHSKH